ncbi:5-oxoprolinase subunit PxpA [Limnoglobus roseus]|uniref:LamB/YcsF family protein n=1 Tax=Limnoglobus roseus TaxID=2598579 RepID=A0A5C1ADN6_9BACT|nr:5-oxoprolinase subunit PxpA [Limnoglobus roseus]QEL16287.1 LamB/YcsF family protein [Limnoglobus roseus]
MLIDLNADLGEGAGLDAELMPLITSANVCCGAHAGSADTVRAALELAAEHGVAVGAHPGYPDRENFGRRELDLTDKQVATLTIHQIGAILGLSRITRSQVEYLKPHGALYNQACREAKYAKPVIASAFLNGLSVVGLPNSELEAAAKAVGLPFIAEGFADRRYRPDGSLVPRTEPDAFLHDPTEAVSQVECLIREKGVRTICVHGDNPEAVAFVRAVREAILARGHELRAFTGRL